MAERVSDKMKRNIIFLILHLSGILGKSVLQEQCYANNSDPYLFFATRTSYFNVDNENAKPIEIEGILFLERYFSVQKYIFDFYRKNMFLSKKYFVFNTQRNCFLFMCKLD